MTEIKDYHFNELILSANTLIDRYNSLQDEQKRRNSLLVLAQKFHNYEERCVRLAGEDGFADLPDDYAVSKVVALNNERIWQGNIGSFKDDK